MARAYVGANIMHPLSWGGGANGEDPIFLVSFDNCVRIHVVHRQTRETMK